MVTANNLGENVEVINLKDMEDVLAKLDGGDDNTEWTTRTGVAPGYHKATITSVRIGKEQFESRDNPGQMVDAYYAYFELNLDDTGFVRRHKIRVFTNDEGVWVDQSFRASARRVLGDAVYEKQIAPLNTIVAKYEKAIDLMLGKKCTVNFQIADKQKDDPDATAWPRGALLSADFQSPGAAEVKGGGKKGGIVL